VGSCNRGLGPLAQTWLARPSSMEMRGMCLIICLGVRLAHSAAWLLASLRAPGNQGEIPKRARAASQRMLGRAVSRW